MIFETVFDAQNSDNKIIIPLDPSWKVLGIQLSGGLDSALLTYLTAVTIQKNNLQTKIRTISCDVGNKPDYLPTARRVLAKIKEITNFENWEKPYEYSIPLAESKNPMKLYASTNHMKALYLTNYIDFGFNGITKNPPALDRKCFTDNDGREVERDTPISIYRGEKSARPLAMCDKRGIIELYVTHDIVSSLLPLTLSCDVNRENVVDGRIPCGRCWWCDERKWGLRSNGLDENL